MAIGIDTSKWKPRSIKGTPAAKFRNNLAVGLISVGMLFGIAFHFSKVTIGIRTVSEKLYEDPIEEVERRQLIAAGLAQRSAAVIRKEIEDSKRPDQPYM